MGFGGIEVAYRIIPYLHEDYMYIIMRVPPKRAILYNDTQLKDID